MKLKKNIFGLLILTLILLSAVSILIARIFFGYDIFDRSGWSVSEDGTLRYLDYHGDAMLGWQEIEGETYYFKPELSGTMATGWLEVEGAQYFLNDSGLKTTGWMSLDEERYYFDEHGIMQTGWLDTDEGRYYLSEDGIMQTGWLPTAEGLCYLSETGAVSYGWVDTEKGRYYIDDNGCMHTGWLETNGYKYFLTEDGLLHTGWLDTEDGRYYFHEDGTMAIGKTMIDGRAQYFTSTGKYFVLVNRWNPVPDDFENDLVWFDGFQVDADCRDDLAAMVEACKAAGYDCILTSAYRGYSYQNTLFQRKVSKLMEAGYTRAAAEAETSRSIAIPGTSEHQLGLAVDLKNSYSTYAWLAQHSWEYGFILRYPDGTTNLTGIYYEPWHFRYVGHELAKELYDLNMCVEAYMDMLTETAA